jgi:hypothetical protein
LRLLQLPFAHLQGTDEHSLPHTPLAPHPQVPHVLLQSM